MASSLITSISMFFSSFDYISPGPSLLHKSNSNYKNLFGSFIGLLALVFSFILIGDDLNNFYSGSDPKVTKTTYYNDNESFDISLSSLKFFLTFRNFDPIKNTITDIPLNIVIDSSASFYMSISSTNITFLNMKYKNPVNDSISSMNQTNVEFLQECKPSFFSDYNDYLEYDQQPISNTEIKKLMSNSLCLSDNLSPIPIYTSNNGQDHVLSISILQDIFKILALDQKYKNPFLSFTYQSVVVNTNDTLSSFPNTKHFRKVWKTKTFQLDENNEMRDFLYIQKTDIKRSAKVLFFPNEDNYTTYTIESMEPYFRVPSTKYTTFAYTLIIRMGNYHSKIQIDYISAEDILGHLGGVYGIFLTIAQVIVGIVVSPFLTSSMLNASFSFHENKEANDQLKYIKKKLEDESLDLIGLESGPLKQQTKHFEFELCKPFQSIEILGLGQGKSLVRKTDDNIIEMHKIESKELENLNCDQSNQMLNINPVMPVLPLLPVMPETAETTHNILHLLNKGLKSRRKISANGRTAFRILYCRKCCIRKHDEAFIDYINLVDHYCEITNLVKFQREIQTLKKLILNKKQSNMLVIPSINLELKEEKPNGKVTLTDFDTELEEIRDKFNGFTIEDKKSLVILENLLESIL